ncbi:MAG: YecA family protein [Desulfobulbaceae bacterium]|nr:YecA family protein [Desulfobulbaceae bacterium]
MLTQKESKKLLKFLLLAPEPEHTFTLNELTGFIFGLAITPQNIQPSEWIPVIFGDDMPDFEDTEQLGEMSDSLIQLYNKFTNNFHDDKLLFPFDIQQLEGESLEELYEWVSGFEEAIALREDLWDPEEHPGMLERKKQELYHSLMTVQGLVEPMEAIEFFEQLPDEIFKEVFPEGEANSQDRELEIQMFLLASLPLSIQTLMDHAKNLQENGTLKKRHGSNKNNVIKVDFSKPKK